MHLTQAQRGGPGAAAPRRSAGEGGAARTRRGARAGAGGAGARHATLGLHLPAAERRRASRDRRRRTGSSARRRTGCSGPLAAASSEWRPWGRPTLFGFLEQTQRGTHAYFRHGGQARLVGGALPRPRVRARDRAARAPDRGGAGDAQRVGRARAVLRRCGGRGSGSRCSTTATAPTTPLQRLLFLAGSVPAGVAAVAIEPASTGDVTVFAISLAVTRLVLAVANGPAGGRDAAAAAADHARAADLGGAVPRLGVGARAVPLRRCGRSGSAIESGAMLERGPRGDAPRAPRARLERARAGRPGRGARRAPLRRALRALPDHPARRGARRGGPVGGGAARRHRRRLDGAGRRDGAGRPRCGGCTSTRWRRSTCSVLELSGGSPTMARAIFAVGHMLPAFALLITASGVGLLLEDDPPRIAYGLACVGVGDLHARHARDPHGLGPRAGARARAARGRDVRVRPAVPRPRRATPTCGS